MLVILSGDNKTFVFLGKHPKKHKSKVIMFKSPSAVHYARWMAESIYSIKIYLFREQFKLTKQEENNL